MFQSTPLCEGRPALTEGWFIVRAGFNPRPCVRGDGRGNLLPVRRLPFQSTPLCEGRPHAVTGTKIEYPFQSTPLCEGRRCRRDHFYVRVAVSIHAPV